MRGAAPLAVAAVLGALVLPGLALACGPGSVTIEGGFGEARFSVAVADDDAERARGLMHVEEMPLMAGMLFVYERPQSVSFWMRNTLIPLDMLFAGADGTIERIHVNAIPLDETPIPGGSEIQFVLEVNGGVADRLGVVIGDQLRHPAIAPCGDG